MGMRWDSLAKNPPLVTIGLPVYNPGPFLSYAIRSVFAQTYPSWELVVVDDGSTDESLERLRRIEDPRVRVLTDGKRRGLPYRLNQILEEASGDFIARMDADDLMDPRRLERQVAYLLKNPGLDAVTTGAYMIDQRNQPFALWPARQPSLQDVLSWGGYLHASLLARRDWYQKNPYSLEYPRAEDREFFVRTWNSATIGVLAEPLYFYRWFGVVKPQNVLLGYASERKILWRYGPQLVGWRRTAVLIGKSYIKTFVTYTAYRFGLVQLLERRPRFSPLDLEDLAKAQSAIRAVAQARVPGWEILDGPENEGDKEV
ncbi:glycosyltransferase family 2 protein [Thermus aquaticus]|nr:glycosyltransferase family 2 protein [Thermus aquaticus]